MSRSIEDIHKEARSGTGSHMYRCYNYHALRVEFYCENCIDDLPSYIDVEGNPKANLFTKCESCGFQHKDHLMNFFLFWMFIYPLITLTTISTMHHNMEMEFFMGKSVLGYWMWVAMLSWLGGGFLMFCIRAIQKKIAREW